jgi:hypothetical protein
MMEFDAFISYSSKDKTTADATCATLEANGIRCWMAPRDIVPGSDWSASIVEALDQCRVMVLIFSAHANASPQIRNEIARAVQRGVPVVPVRIEDIAPTKSLAYFMTAVHWLDALTPPLEHHLQRLGVSIKSLLQIPVTEAEATCAAKVPPSYPAPVVVPVERARRTGAQEWLVRGLAIFACVTLLAGAALIYLRANNTETCELMWKDRNSYYKLRGFCFRTPRAIAAFGNDGCTEQDAAKVYSEKLSSIERQRVNTIRTWEWIYGCPI